MPRHHSLPRPETPRSRHSGRAWSAAGTVAGLIASWGAVHAAGSPNGPPTGEIVATTLAGSWLLILAIGWLRDRRRRASP